MKRTPLDRFLFETGMDLEDLIEKKNIGISYRTLVDFRRGFKQENLREKIRTKYPIEKVKGENMFFPDRHIDEPKDYWVKKIKEVFDIDIEIVEIVPAHDKFSNVFFKILTKPKRIKYDPDEATRKKVAKQFKGADWRTIYEDRSAEKD